MNPLRIAGTGVSPTVNFDLPSKTFEISGFSRPENVRDFYYPLILWLDEFKAFLLKLKSQEPSMEPIPFKFKLIYFNSSSAKFIYDIILMLNDLQKAEIPLEICWYYDEEDEELREAGEELSGMAQVPFRYVEVKRNA